MTFADAVKSSLTQYVGFSGRARRSEFWFFFLFTVIVGVVASILDAILFDASGRTGPINALANLALFLPSLAVAARRLHDTGRSGWWLLLIFVIIIGWIILIVWYCQDSQGDNQYGPSPKYAGGQQMMPPYPGQVPPPYPGQAPPPPPAG